MIVGELASTRKIVVPLTLYPTDGGEETIRAVIDTGFGSFLLLPPDTIRALSLRQNGVGHVTLGDGSEATLPKYRARIRWDGRERIVPVYGADGDPLVGMMLLYGFDFHVHVVDGGMVALNRLP